MRSNCLSTSQWNSFFYFFNEYCTIKFITLIAKIKTNFKSMKNIFIRCSYDIIVCLFLSFIYFSIRWITNINIFFFLHGQRFKCLIKEKTNNLSFFTSTGNYAKIIIILISIKNVFVIFSRENKIKKKGYLILYISVFNVTELLMKKAIWKEKKKDYYQAV